MPITAIDPDNLPTQKVEEWKFTNLPRAIPANLNRDGDAGEHVIHIKRGEIRDNPVEINFKGVDNAYQVDHIIITLEEGAQATIIERHEGQGAYWKNHTTKIEIGKNAHLKHIRLQNDTHDAVNTNIVHMTIDQNATYDSFNLNMGGKLSRHEIHAEIAGKGAEASFNGANLLQGSQHGDTTIVIEHQAPNCQSNQFYRTLLDDKARGVFQGKVHVHQEAQKTDGYQLSNALLLSPDAEMDTKPELEIYADDVKCSHGATTGQLDEEPLFYLRQRGLSEAQARLLLIQAFIYEAVDKVSNESLREEILSITTTWLENALKA
ncbi:MAG: Fe-S cluster assembly protein SufD [Alphaproteobacteria bacterium]|nr:Fe-S cluster assembly protein SufD [Alphaproteobacteria bacterium]